MSIIIKEGTDARFTAPIVDRDGVPVPLVDLLSLELTLEDLDTGEIINAWDAKDVLNVNGGVVDGDSVLVLPLTPAENIIINDAKLYEFHRWLLEWTWNSGGVEKSNKEYGDYAVENLRQVTS